MRHRHSDAGTGRRTTGGSCNDGTYRGVKAAQQLLLTRARQGMVLLVPFGDAEDETRDPRIYNGTFEYLRSIGLEVI